MGTTLTAIVEVVDTIRWQVALVRFNKDYVLMRDLYDHKDVIKRWPADMGFDARRAIEDGADGDYWCSRETFGAVMRREPREGFVPQARALHALIESLWAHGWETRLLFEEC